MNETIRSVNLDRFGVSAFRREVLPSNGFMAHWTSISKISVLDKAPEVMPKDDFASDDRNRRKCCKIFLIGPFAVADREGNCLTPKSQKAKALIAMLALSLRGSRSRVWLRDKLWSDRSEDQAAGSLRQALLEVRKALGNHRDVLTADNNTVHLDMDQVELDVDSVSDRPDAASHEFSSEHFLEGIDIRDAEFEEWLCLERQSWQARFEEGLLRQSLPLQVALTRYNDRHSPLLPQAVTGATSDGTPLRGGVDLGDKMRPEGWHRRRQGLVIALDPPQIVGATQRGRIAACEIESLLFKSLHDMYGIGVTDLSFDTGSAEPGADRAGQTLLPLNLALRLVFEGSRLLCQIVIRRTADNTLVWTGSESVGSEAVESGTMTALHSIVWRTVDQIGNFIINHYSEEQMHVESLSARAVNSIFALTRADLDSAEQMLLEGLRDAPHPSFYAWLAFIQTFRIGQRYDTPDGIIAEKAQAYASKALLGEPDNAVVLALVGHVHSYMFCEYDLAAELFEKSIRLNPALPLSWDLYAMLHCYTGQPEKGAAMSQWVGQLGVFSRYKYYFDTTKCICAALTGNHKLAIKAGEDALQARPGFNSILRYLVASQANAGDLAAARRYLDKLLQVEKDFSIQSLRDSRYPLLRAGGGGLFVDGLLKMDKYGGGLSRTSHSTDFAATNGDR